MYITFYGGSGTLLHKIANKSDIIFFITVCITGIFDYIGLTVNPTFFEDEFIYSGRAYNFLAGLYNSVYLPERDHPPLGPFILSLIAGIVPGDLIFTLKCRIAVALLGLTIPSMIYLITRKEFGYPTLSFITAESYIFLAGYIFLRRLVLLDNLALPFVLFAYFFYLKGKPSPGTNGNSEYGVVRGIYLFISGVFASVAVWTKLPFATFVIGILLRYLLSELSGSGKLYVKGILRGIIPFVLGLIPVSVSVLWFYIASGRLLSFITYQFYQMGRSDIDSITGAISAQFIYAPIFAGLSAVVYVIALFKGLVRYTENLSRRRRYRYARNITLSFNRLFGLCTILFPYLVFLFRGKLLFFFYFIPVIPFSCIILVGFFAMPDSMEIDRKKIYISLLVGIVIAFPWRYDSSFTIKTPDYVEILDWVGNNIPRNATIVVDDFFIAELRAMGYKYVRAGYSVEPDELMDGRIDYIIAENKNDVFNSVTAEAVSHAVPVITFKFDTFTTRTITVYFVKNTGL